MIKLLIDFSLKNRLIIVLFIIAWIGFGLYSLSQISIGAVPDITNNQVQVITNSPNLTAQEIEKFITVLITEPLGLLKAFISYLDS